MWWLLSLFCRPWPKFFSKLIQATLPALFSSPSSSLHSFLKIPSSLPPTEAVPHRRPTEWVSHRCSSPLLPPVFSPSLFPCLFAALLCSLLFYPKFLFAAFIRRMSWASSSHASCSCHLLSPVAHAIREGNFQIFFYANKKKKQF